MKKLRGLILMLLIPLSFFGTACQSGSDTLLLEGGSIINGAFQRADAIDALSLVVAPVTADKDDKPLFADSIVTDFELTKTEAKDGTLILNYRRKEK